MYFITTALPSRNGSPGLAISMRRRPTSWILRSGSFIIRPTRSTPARLMKAYTWSLEGFIWNASSNFEDASGYLPFLYSSVPSASSCRTLSPNDSSC
jgi:hypothetical protein